MHSVLPDGSVDLVIKVNGGVCYEYIYGTTTTKNVLSIELGSHYLGIRFKPGQSRHFLHVSAVELTDSMALANGLLKFDLRSVPELIEYDRVFSVLDEILGKYLHKSLPLRSTIDDAISRIESTNGSLPITDSASIYGKSIRQFERHFRETVGISAKLFSEITRFRRASRRISCVALPLAQIAADLGYTDQSHMSREFRRFANCSPSIFSRNHVVFLQDQHHIPIDNGGS